MKNNSRKNNSSTNTVERITVERISVEQITVERKNQEHYEVNKLAIVPDFYFVSNSKYCVLLFIRADDGILLYKS